MGACPQAFGGYGKEGEEHGGKFTQYQADDCGCGGEGQAFFQGDLVYDIDGCYAYKLFEELGAGGDGCFLETVVVAADAGMTGSEGDGD